MKKNVLLSFFFSMAFFAGLNAQLAVDHDSLYTVVDNGTFDVVSHNFMSNGDAEDKDFRWVRNNIDFPTDWTSAVCDPVQCYFHTVDSMEFTLPANSTGQTLDVHCYPNGNYSGQGTVEVTVFEIDNPQNSITGLFVFDAGTTNTSEAQKVQFKVYPNPTSGLFSLEGTTEEVAFLSVYTTTGQRLLHTSVQDGELYNIWDLNDGVYLLQLSDKEGTPIGNKLINKF